MSLVDCSNVYVARSSFATADNDFMGGYLQRNHLRSYREGINEEIK